jgi:hypothetical protein
MIKDNLRLRASLRACFADASQTGIDHTLHVNHVTLPILL